MSLVALAATLPTERHGRDLRPHQWRWRCRRGGMLWFFHPQPDTMVMMIAVMMTAVSELGEGLRCRL